MLLQLRRKQKQEAEFGQQLEQLRRQRSEQEEQLQQQQQLMNGDRQRRDTSAPAGVGAFGSEPSLSDALLDRAEEEQEYYQRISRRVSRGGRDIPHSTNCNVLVHFIVIFFNYAAKSV